jgi:formylmethanofuran dehydrogenase subunit B
MGIKKILLIDYSKYTNIDGSAKYNYELAKFLASCNYNVTHFNIGLSNYIQRVQPLENVIQLDATYNKHYESTGGFIKAWRKYRIGIKQLLSHLHDNKYDLIIDSTQIAVRRLSKKIPQNRL